MQRSQFILKPFYRKKSLYDRANQKLVAIKNVHINSCNKGCSIFSLFYDL